MHRVSFIAKSGEIRRWTYTHRRHFSSEVTMAIGTIAYNVRVAWWLKLYFYGLATLCAITGCEPNWQHVKYWINKGVTVKAIR